MSIVDAAEDFARRLATDPPSAAVVITLNPEPSLWLLTPNGKAVRLETLTRSTATPGTQSSRGWFSTADLVEAARWLSDVANQLRWQRNGTPADAITEANRRRSARLMRPIEAALAAAALHHCDTCGRTFKTKGGRTRHVNAKHRPPTNPKD